MKKTLKPLLAIISAILSFTLVVSFELTNSALQIALAEDAEALEEASENLPASSPGFDSFSDVKEENYHYVPIIELAKEGIINGYDDGTFHPYDTINRAEALKIILETFRDFSDESYVEPDKRPFQDVPLGAWHSKYIVTALDLGIIHGYDDGTFRPWDTINLAEALTMITQSLENYIAVATAEEAVFADVALDVWFAEYFSYAKSREMINITDNNNVHPEQEMTRGYFAEIIYKLKNFSNDFHFGKATFYGAVSHGSGTASGKTFDMYAMTAAHKELPFGTIVEVENLANGKTVQVEITDRGPYGPGRVIDLTSAAFDVISDLHRGIINVQYKVVEEP
ncbi:MAG: septal ring lytic transglycosylase RlpA family protein [Candidatus Gracilibacteria bacterium]